MAKLTKLLEAIKSPPEPKRDYMGASSLDYMGASSLGHPCWRKVWYDVHSENAPEFTPRQLRTFALGHAIEKLVLDAVVCVTPVKRNYPELVHPDYPWLRGHIDAYLPKLKAILEIKSANHASFQQFEKHGLRKWNEQYYSQVQLYMGLSGIHQTYVLVFDKNTSAVADNLVEFNEMYYEMLVQKAVVIHGADSEPPRVNESPLYFLCRMCSYRGECRSKK
jgi:hypothetical protein